jgi:hypothetical protein
VHTAFGQEDHDIRIGQAHPEIPAHGDGDAGIGEAKAAEGRGRTLGEAMATWATVLLLTPGTIASRFGHLVPATPVALHCLLPPFPHSG